MNCIIIHGTMGCPDENWFLWAQGEIAKVLNCNKFEVLTPHFPYIIGSNEYQGYNLWKKLLLVYKEAGLLNEETILIGHSLGPVFIYRFLAETKTKVKAVISVSGKNNNWLNIKQFDNFNFDFYCDWDTLKDATQYVKYRYAFFSDNDPYIPFLNCRKFSNAIQAEEIIINGGGHINASEGYTEFPQLIELIKKIVKEEIKETTANKDKNFLDLEEPLEESANIICKEASNLCKHGIMDDDCLWYHSVWQYLRMLDLVSTPSWHDLFYQKELNNALESNKTNNILITGTADYSMLAYVTDAIKRKNVKANVYVLDTCKTPLFACEWFANKMNFEIKTINEDVLKYKNDNFFDIICTDAFLTRFKKADAEEVIEKWRELLNENGKIITTIRIYENNINKSEDEKEKDILEFKEKARERCTKKQKYIQYSSDKIAEMAEIYARKMHSNNLGNINDIVDMFSKFSISYNVNTVLGEFERTKYLELIAKK